jgi:hypothetical protein
VIVVSPSIIGPDAPLSGLSFYPHSTFNPLSRFFLALRILIRSAMVIRWPLIFREPGQ